jgi:hypothetical protein
MNANDLSAMRPFCQLVRRIDRVLVFLVVCAHGGRVFGQRVGRHAFVDIVVVWDLDFARELDVVVLLFEISFSLVQLT